MKKQVFTALALATMIGAASSGALAASVQPPMQIQPAGDGLVILEQKATGASSATASHAMPTAEAVKYQDKVSLQQQDASTLQNQSFVEQTIYAFKTFYRQTVGFFAN